MRVRCSECDARYQVDEGLVRGRRVKLRCRRCGAEISVSAAGQELAHEPAVPGPPPPPSPPAWFAVVGGDLSGPFFSNELRCRIEQGFLGADALLWRAGMPQWVPLVAVEEVARWFDLSAMPPLPPPVLGQVPPPRGFAPPLPSMWPPGAPPSSPLHPQMVGSPMLSRTPIRRPRRWPVWAACIGTVMMVVAASLVLLPRWQGTGRQAADPRESGPVTGAGPRKRRSPLAIHIGRAEIRIAREDLPDAGNGQRRWRVTRLPPVEVLAEQDAGSLLGGEDRGNVLAARLFRRNQGALIACAKLAERRGVDLAGRVAVFEILVDGRGAPTVEVSGRGLGRKLVSCYRAVVQGFSFPGEGVPYRLRVRHVH